MSCSNCGNITLPNGSNGLNGYNAFTVTTASYVVPAIAASVVINVSAQGQYTGIWAVVGQIIFIQSAGYYEVVSSTQAAITAINTGYTGNAVAGVVIAAGSNVSPSGLQGTSGTSGSNGVAVLDDDYTEVQTILTTYDPVKTLVLANTVFTQAQDGIQVDFIAMANIAGVTSTSNASVELELNDGVNPAVLFALPIVAMTKSSNAFKGKLIITRTSATQVSAMLYYNIGVLITPYATAVVLATFQSDAVSEYAQSTTLDFTGNISLKLKLKVGGGTVGDATKVNYWSVLHRKK